MEEKVILEKISRLSELTRKKLSSQLVFDVIGALEKKYNVKLFMVLARLVIGDILPKNLADYLLSELKLETKGAKEVADRLFWLLTDLNSVGGQASSQVDDSSNAKFLFFTEDESDVERFKNFTNSHQKKYDYESLAELIVFESGYKTGDLVMDKRLFDVVLSRLRDVRDDLEARSVLTKSRKIGGMELTEEQTDKLIDLISDKVSRGLLKEKSVKKENVQKISFVSPKPLIKNGQEIKQKIETEKNKLKTASVLAVAEKSKPLAMGIYATQNGAVRAKQPILTIKEEDGLPVIEPLIPDGHKNFSGSESATMKMENKKSAPLPLRGMATPKTMPPATGRKPRVDEIRTAPKIMGPIEELENMTLIDFRRLSDTAVSAIGKIKEKINLLEMDSYGKKLAGIEAWQKSEVVRFYRLLGQESMNLGRSVETIIKERFEAHKPTLSIEEFEAIMSLNKDLRY